MNRRTRTLWLPGILSLAGSMGCRLILQRTVGPTQTLLNHAGLPLRHQLIWLALLPMFGAASAYFSRRAGGDRLSIILAALFPSIAMVPLWMVLAVKMYHPSASQWFGLFSGVMNWIVLPGVALLLGAVPFLKSQKGEALKS